MAHPVPLPNRFFMVVDLKYIIGQFKNHIYKISRILSGYFVKWIFAFSFFMLIIGSACSDHTVKGKMEIKIAKTVPPIFINGDDPRFLKKQDTVYFENNYFTGNQFGQYPSGDTAYIRSYFNGVEEGFQQKWYPNKELAEKRFYINGKKEGIHQGWWPDGKLKFFFEADGDEYNGEFKEWYPSGLLGKYFHYENGQEEGSEKLWWNNGAVRANYVMIHGKKYGFLGLKTCINPYDSIIKK